MRVLVTGHDGYIGTILVPMLQEAGMDVVGLDSLLFHDCLFGDDVPPPPAQNGDVRDVLPEQLEGIEAIVHLAGLSNDPLGNLNPEVTMDINHRASVRLAELARDAGVRRFVFSSSCSNYGAAGDTMLDESAAFNPVTPYGRSKVAVEQDVAPMASDAFTPVFLRSATAYGVSPRLRFDLVLNNLVAWAYTTGRVYLKSDGTPWRPIVHIEDISRAFKAVVEAPAEAVHARAFNVGRTDENYQMHELAEIVAETVPECKVEYAPDAGPDARCYRVSCDALPEAVPAFEPQWDARRGAREVYEACKAIGLTLEAFEGPQYQRIAHIRSLIEQGVIDGELYRLDRSPSAEGGSTR
jgi:nucleoside-diphosphate-sugar epimerase